MSKKYDFKFKKLAKIKSLEVEEKELTRSPISGTYILKEWNNDLKPVKDSKKKSSNEVNFTKSEVALNNIAASFVEITPQARARLEKIPNKIGPYECKLCKVVYLDAFELAMHNCPRVVHMEYKCFECGKVFNCPANLASHKRWHKPKTSIFKNESTKLDIETTIQNQEKNVTKIEKRKTYIKYEQQSNQNKNNQIYTNTSFYNQMLFNNYNECYGTQFPVMNTNSIDCINQYLYSNIPLFNSSSAITSDQVAKSASLLTQFYSNYLTATHSFFNHFPIGMSFPISSNSTLASVQFLPFDQSNIN